MEADTTVSVQQQLRTNLHQQGGVLVVVGRIPHQQDERLIEWDPDDATTAIRELPGNARGVIFAREVKAPAYAHIMHQAKRRDLPTVKFRGALTHINRIISYALMPPDKEDAPSPASEIVPASPNTQRTIDVLSRFMERGAAAQAAANEIIAAVTPVAVQPTTEEPSVSKYNSLRELIAGEGDFNITDPILTKEEHKRLGKLAKTMKQSSNPASIATYYGQERFKRTGYSAIPARRKGGKKGGEEGVTTAEGETTTNGEVAAPRQRRKRTSKADGTGIAFALKALEDARAALDIAQEAVEKVAANETEREQRDQAMRELLDRLK